MSQSEVEESTIHRSDQDQINGASEKIGAKNKKKHRRTLTLLKKKAGKPNKADGKNKRKARAGLVAGREIQVAQRTVNQLLPRAAFKRLFRDTLKDVSDQPLRIQASAIDALQEAGEAYVIDLMLATKRLADHANRKTVLPLDFREAVKNDAEKRAEIQTALR